MIATFLGIHSAAASSAQLQRKPLPEQQHMARNPFQAPGCVPDLWNNVRSTGPCGGLPAGTGARSWIPCHLPLARSRGRGRRTSVTRPGAPRRCTQRAGRWSPSSDSSARYRRYALGQPVACGQPRLATDRAVGPVGSQCQEYARRCVVWAPAWAAACAWARTAWAMSACRAFLNLRIQRPPLSISCAEMESRFWQIRCGIQRL